MTPESREYQRNYFKERYANDEAFREKRKAAFHAWYRNTMDNPVAAEAYRAKKREWHAGRSECRSTTE